jgi:uncharacterized protein
VSGIFSTFALPPLLGTPLGHVWTLKYHVKRRQQRALLGASEPFALTFCDPLTSELTLSGWLHTGCSPQGQTPRDLVVLIHGLGGSAESGYMYEAARAALASGCSVLRLSLRGADTAGTDFYHAGLYSDVLRVLQHEKVRRYHNVYLLGISLGGHVVLRTACCVEVPPNLRAVATLCPPLDLAACGVAFDKKRQWVYRRHVLNSLKQMYARFAADHTAACGKLGLPSARAANTIASIGEWDRAIVAPRHGFSSATDYYTTQSAGPRLGEVHIPALVLTTRWDPMVPKHTTADFLHPPSPSNAQPPVTLEWGTPGGIAARWVLHQVTRHVQHVELHAGGHIAFPQAGKAEVFAQTVSWLQQHAD